MSLAVNHNLMAANTARNLNTHYGRLATSTQRLSSGLRIKGAADDAAGLAIRELMRTDVAALNQGVRNANDAISMIQVVEGALGVIDEKLIRMKELAEQAATGTYDSTQRLMIDSEFQAMASEIQRIATATDFNGIKLLNGVVLNENVVDYSNIKLDNPITNTTTFTDRTKNTYVSGDRYSTNIKVNIVTDEIITDTTINTTVLYFKQDGEIFKKTTESGEVEIWEYNDIDSFFRENYTNTLSNCMAKVSPLHTESTAILILKIKGNFFVNQTYHFDKYI